ncbi:MAG TPA: tetratricopeptide repeat protein [Blastocatellia bacterium]|nr:tetratricopeptide repeat protein [Blastocatellia bacterium]
MKHCPTCHRVYTDDALNFCRSDGAPLVADSASSESASTVILNGSKGFDSSSSKPITPSIAVLPFVNISADLENEYFCDGLAEELINALARIEELKVAARTSAFSFKGKQEDVREIGRRLGVGSVLEGSVRKTGDQLRITAQLIDVGDGYPVWSGRYDRRLADIFTIQEEITLAIVNGLKLRLQPTDRAALLKRYTDNAEAYQLYLKGRYHQNKWTPEGLRKSVQYFEEAIATDSDYALAYAGLADSYTSLYASEAFSLPPSQTATKARTAAKKAIDIDNALAEAHASLATVNLNFDWDFKSAEKEFQTALELNPNYSNGYHLYSHYLIALGRMDESLAASRKALELNPLDLETNIHLGWHYYFARDYDRAIDIARTTLEMDSAFSEALWFTGWSFVQKGQYDDAIEAYKRSRSLQENHEILAWLGHAYALSGDRKEAQEFLNKINEDSNQMYVSPYWPAIICLGLDQTDETFEWLQRAYDERNSWLIYLGVNPIFDSLRSDVRFRTLMRLVGLSAS